MMTRTATRTLLILLAAAALTAAYHRTKSSTVMAAAANNFLAMLSPEQRAKATFALDDKERLNWHFVPRERKGLPLREMDAGQRALAEALLSAGLSQAGYAKVAGILSLEPVLHVMENAAPGRRDAAGYFFSIFGEPSPTNTWGWRFEGHHVALNYTVIKGEATASTPAFFGANPAELKDGPRKGFRALAREEDLARDLLHSLDAKQKTAALLDPTAPKDILSSNKLKADPIDPKGIANTKLTKAQAAILMALIEEYVSDMPADIGAARMDAIRKAGIDKIHFAWLGGPDRGQPHYYRVQGPTFLAEYDNTQNNANHIHSVWRDFQGDFGLDLLAAHYRQFHDAKAPVAAD
ncbi:MAG: DUF3500 domain-containing protein [Bryobacteraceae bacterium]